MRHSSIDGNSQGNNIYKEDGEKVSRKEAGDCTDWCRAELWVLEAQLGQCGDKKLALAGRRLASPEASSWSHSWSAAAGFAREMNVCAGFLLNTKNSERNSTE